MSRPPAFQFYAPDFLSDASVMAMTLEERGAYITLLAVAWMEDGIPSAPAALARLLSVSKRKLDSIWPALEPCWIEDEHTGALVNSRMEEVRQEQANWRKKSSKGGRASAKARANQG